MGTSQGPDGRERRGSFRRVGSRNSLAVQWLRFCASPAGGMGSVPGGGAMCSTACYGAAKKKRKKNEWESCLSLCVPGNFRDLEALESHLLEQAVSGTWHEPSWLPTVGWPQVRAED